MLCVGGRLTAGRAAPRRRGDTKYPALGLAVTRWRSSSQRKACTAVDTETPFCVATSRTEGKRWPALKTWSSIMRAMRCAICA